MEYSNWILGDHGSDKIAILSEHLFEKIRKHESLKKGQELPSYMPWHSCPELSTLLDDKTISVGDDKLIRDPSLLKNIAEAIYMSDEKPLGKVSIKTDRMAINCNISFQDLQVYALATALVLQAGNPWKKNFSSLVRLLIPLHATGEVPRQGGVGFSTEHMKGAVFLSVPSQPNHKVLELAINLVHEMGHQALMIYQASDAILNCELGKPVFSGVRKTFRPAIHSFHALIALSFMVDFLNAISLKPIFSEEEFAYLRSRHIELSSDLETALRGFQKIPLTKVGEKLYDEANCVFKVATSKMEKPWSNVVSL